MKCKNNKCVSNNCGICDVGDDYCHYPQPTVTLLKAVENLLATTQKRPCDRMDGDYCESCGYCKAERELKAALTGKEE